MRLVKSIFLIILLLFVATVSAPLFLHAEQGSDGLPPAAQWPVKAFETGGEIKSLETEVEYTDGTKKKMTIDFLTNPGAGDSTELSSDFGPRSLTGSPMHGGMDIPVGDGTQVFATVGGEVDFKGWTSNGGYIIRIKGDDGRFYEYMHLIEDEPNTGYEALVKVGMLVKTGQQIGWSDSTVNEDGDKCAAHLHLDVYTVGTRGERLFVNPLSVLPYLNTETPKVEILNPQDRSVVGATADTEEVEIQVKVTAKEKDVSKLVLSIDGVEAEFLGADFNFEKEGRKNVVIDIKGEKYISKGGKWVKATDAELKNRPSYVRVTVVDKTHTDDTINTFIYNWNTWAFLDTNKVEFKKDVSIKAVAYQAQGEETGVAEIKVDVGYWGLSIDRLIVENAKKLGEGAYECIKTASANIISLLKSKEAGVQLEKDKVRVRMKAKSAEQVLTPTITITADGEAEASAQATGLEDGMHTATVEVLDDNGQATDSKQKLFMVDTTPPVILKDKLEDKGGGGICA